MNKRMRDSAFSQANWKVPLLHQLQREQQTKRFPPPSLQVSDEEVVPPVASPQCEVALPLFLGL